MRVSAFCLFLTLLMGIPLFVCAQDDDISVESVRRDQLVWFRYQLELPLSSKWRLEQELEERLYAGPFRHAEIRARSHFIRSLGQGWYLTLGNMFSLETEPIEPRREGLETRLEIRPHQHIFYQHTLGDNWQFQHTYQLEQRFFQNQNEDGSFGGSGMSLGQIRYRYSLETEYMINDWFGLIATGEVVLYTGPDVGPNPFDRTEFGAGFHFKLSEAFSLEPTYVYRYNPDGIGFNVIHQHTARFTLMHRINRGR